MLHTAGAGVGSDAPALTPAPAPIGSGSRSRFAPLDGVRALAVTAVILFHASPSWAIGGYYGVDLFFILSGYLITSLLLAEWQRSGGIALRAFWGRRARRLLPALFLMLAVVGAAAALFPQALGSPDLFGDTLSTLGYVANWHFIAAHTDYFATVSNPSPLQHTWTLAIEEQFYLVWPLALMAMFWAVGRRRPRTDLRGGLAPSGPSRWRAQLVTVAVIAGVGAIVSALLMAALTPIGATSVTRAYYGSDTRAQGLLVGCALAALCLWWGPIRTVGGRRALSVIGVAGAVGVVLMCRMVTESSAFAFHGGFLVVAFCGAAVIAVVTQIPRHVVGRVLSTRPLPYLGRISYGMYLWYWPVLLVMTSARTHVQGVVLLACRMVVIVVVAGASYRLVETPIQRGALSRWRAWVAIPSTVAALMLLPLLAPLSESPVASIPSTPAAFQSASGSGPQGLPTSAHPVRVLILGDSMAGTLGVGLSQTASRYGVEVINEGTPGCSLASADSVKVLTYTDPPGKPCRVGDPAHLLDDYRSLITEYNPDVVLYLARSDTLTTYLDGTWQYAGMPSFDRWTASRFEQAIPILSSQGARVVFLTSPIYDTGEESDGSPWPEDDPKRVAADNHLITEAVKGHNGVASVIDLGQMLTPGGHFEPSVDNVPLRCADGVHVTIPGGEWVGTRILPQIVSLGQAHAEAEAVQTRAPLAPQPLPSWYHLLHCGT